MARKSERGQDEAAEAQGIGITDGAGGDGGKGGKGGGGNGRNRGGGGKGGNGGGGGNGGNGDGTSGEQLGGDKRGLAIISGVTFANRSVVYSEVDGMAIVEGDIALGTVERVEAATAAARSAAGTGDIAEGVGITGSRFRWPNAQVPYEIDPNLPNPQRVTDAIAHWEARTRIRFPLRTAANAAQFPNFVRFADAGGCWSEVGMQGGGQTISLGPSCSTGNTIHEIGHAVGLWHEQSREDRDLFVTVHWENIQDGKSHNFNQHIVDGDDLGAYDYGSIMHYPRFAFSRNGQPTLTPVDANAQIGQRDGLSPGDIAAVEAMYPFPLKHVRDSGVVKSLRDELWKAPSDRKPIDPIKAAGFDQRVVDPRKIVTLPAVRQLQKLLPFALATSHHADVADDGDAAAALTDLHQQLLDLDAQLAALQASAAQAAAEGARLQQYRDALAAAYAQALGAGSG